MEIIPKYKLGTIIAIEKQIVMDYFLTCIDFESEEAEKESYTCKDGSLLILQPSNNENKVFVKFHCNLQVNPQEKSVCFLGAGWFLDFCKKNNLEIQNLRTKTVMPSSEGAIMSDIFTSEAFRLAKHYVRHPKDRTNDNSK